MPRSVVTEFKHGFQKQGERGEEKTNEPVVFNLFTYAPNGTEISKKGSGTFFNDFIITRHELKDSPDVIGKIEN